MKLDGIHHIAVNVSDIYRAEKFYTDVLGLHVVERYDEEMRYLILDSGNTCLHLFENPELPLENAINCLSVEGFAHIAFGTNRECFLKLLTN
jgi:catechol 2,3-dioxygenase-like lactoylglutathione lyase family enzyme